MSNVRLNAFLSASWKSSAAILPIAIACAQMPANAQAPAANSASAAKKTQAELEAEAAAEKAKAAADDPTAADDAAAAARAGGASGKDIVVTGTSIRGVAPTGTQLITVGEAEIKATGATSVSQILATIPQIGGNFFNGLPQAETADSTAAGNSAKPFSAPQLRPSPAGSDAGSSTLILINGNRQSSVGVNQAVGNPDTVPPGLLERVEVNTDGGSAIYGSDAIGGVINFVTKRRFDGVQVSGRYGWADGGYATYDVNGIVGKDWGSGSAYISYSYANQDTLYGFKRDFYRPIDFSTGLDLSVNCDTPNVRINAITGTSTTLHYYASTAAGISTTPFTIVAPPTGTPNVCSNNSLAALSNGFKRHNAMASVAQDFGDSVKLTVRGRFSKNNQVGTLAPFTYSATITSDNPYFRPLTDNGQQLTSYAVLGNFNGLLGPERRRFTSGSKQYGAVAELSWSIDGNWQLRGSLNWDQSRSQQAQAALGAIAPNFEGGGGAGTSITNTASLTNPATTCRNAVLAVTAAGGRTATTPAALTAIANAQAACFNPFNITASNSSLLTPLGTTSTFGRGRDRIINFKGVLDGALFDLPGGKVKIALGAEYKSDKYASGLASGPISTTPIILSGVKQNVQSAFFELNVPLVSSANSMPMVRELRVAASGRYDHYSQFGGTFNPRFGATYKPFDWLSIRGTWGKSFRAPTAPDLIGTTFGNTTVRQFVFASTIGFFATDPAHPPTAQQVNAVILLGTQPDLGPQKGKNWSVGGEFTPFKGFRATVTYYRNNLIGAIGNPGAAVQTFPALAFLANINTAADPITQAEYDAFKAKGTLFGGPGAFTTDLGSIYGLFDFRSRNLGNSHIAGLDYSVRYSRNFDFGTAFISASGNIQLVNETQTAPGQPFISNIGSKIALGALSNANTAARPVSLHRITLQTGLTSGGFQGTLTLNRSDGFKLTPTAVILQDRVKAFNVVNLFLSYTFTGDSWYQKGLQLSLSVNNVFDQDPPELRTTNGQQNGFTNGSTIGRLIQVGITKKF